MHQWPILITLNITEKVQMPIIMFKVQQVITQISINKTSCSRNADKSDGFLDMDGWYGERKEVRRKAKQRAQFLTTTGRLSLKARNTSETLSPTPPPPLPSRSSSIIAYFFLLPQSSSFQNRILHHAKSFVGSTLSIRYRQSYVSFLFSRHVDSPKKIN